MKFCSWFYSQDFRTPFLKKKKKPDVTSVREDSTVLYLKEAFKATISFSIDLKKIKLGWLAHLVRVVLIKTEIKNFTQRPALSKEFHTDYIARAPA